MLQNYFKLALRGLLKSPLFTALNVFGLAFGLAVSLLLFLHVRQEISFDRYHSKADRIHRVILNAFWDPAAPEVIANAPNALGPAMKEEIPAVEQYARVLQHEFGEAAFITAGNNKMVEEKLYWADPGFFEIFDIPVIAGDLKSALSQPNTVALSRSTAIRYFGTENAIGQSIHVDRMESLVVRAVYEDFPANSSFDANVLGSFQSVKWAQKRVWSNASFETWLLLGTGAEPVTVESQMAALLDKNVAKDDQRYSFHLQALPAMHLHSAHMRYNYASKLGDPKQVGILGILALTLLLIACFNYMNLSTARAQLRFREVGINKTMGASRRQVAGRFYLETAVLTGFSLLLAVGILYLAIPLFNRLADTTLRFDDVLQFRTMASIVGIGLLVTLVAGAYPAFFLSAYLPKNLLQTTFQKSGGAGWLRRSLVTAQFTVSIILIIGTLALYQQMQFIRQKKLGFEPEQVLAVNTVAAESKEQLDALIQGCRNLFSVTSVCRAQSYPGYKASSRTLMRSGGDAEGIQILTNRCTPGIENVLGLKILAGATLPEKQPGDTTVHVLLNKKAVAYLGFTPEEAIGKKVSCQLGENAFICGVVEDFHAESLHNPIGAYAFHDDLNETRRFLLLKLTAGNLPETMIQIEQEMSKALPQSAFEYTFLDEHFDALYRSDQRSAGIVLIFSLLSVFLCCLGLFGLAAFAAEQRRKEIGVRKVLGASVLSIAALLNRDFLKLMLLAIVLATPVAHYFLQRWLAGFAYHIELQWWLFALAGLIGIVIAMLTVSFQSIRAAVVNPVDSLIC